MPNLDRTGPQGMGPMTGRRLGRCYMKGNVEDQKIQQVEPGEIYGLGRGGRPYGGGNGRRGIGRRFGR